VRVVRSHRIALVPTPAQEVLLRQAVGVSRFAYNWALAEWKRQYQAGEKPNEAALRRQLNAIKREQFPWMGLVPKSVPQQAIKNCGAAFERFFKRQGPIRSSRRRGCGIRPAWTTVPVPSGLMASACACRSLDG
jgi:putative transposase